MTRVNGRAPGSTGRHRDTHDVSWSRHWSLQGEPAYYCRQCRRWFRFNPSTSSR